MSDGESRFNVMRAKPADPPPSDIQIKSRAALHVDFRINHFSFIF